MAVTRWTKEQVESFRAWHTARIKELYSADDKLIKQLTRDRENFLSRVTPRD